MILRGGVYWVELETEGRRPVCVLTRGAAIDRLRNIVVAPITTRIRGIASEVPLGVDDGLPRDCAISLDNLRTVPKSLLTEQITQLGPQRMRQVCRALGASVDC